MKQYIITGIEPKKDKVKVYLYSPEESTITEVNLPHIIPSRPLPLQGDARTVDEVLALLKKKGIKDLQIKTGGPLRVTQVDEKGSDLQTTPIDQATIEDAVALSSQKRIIQLAGPSSMKKELYDLNDVFPIGKRSKNGTDPRNNVSRVHRLQFGYPFSQAQLDEGTLKIDHRFPQIESLVALPSASFDIEARGWEPFYAFTDLDISEDVMRAYLNERIKKRIDEVNDDIDSVREVFDVLPRSDREHAQEIIDQERSRIVSLRNDLKQLDSASKPALVELVKREKFEDAFYEPFAICYVTPDAFPNVYFSIYEMPEKVTEVETRWGPQRFFNIVVKDLDQINPALEELVDQMGERGERVDQYVKKELRRVHWPSEAISLMFAATMRAVEPFITGGHNIGSYDFPNLRGKDRKKSFLKCGIGGEAPFIDADMGFLKRSRIPGFYYIDTLPLMINFVPGSKNNKLVTFTEMLFGEKDFKDLDYTALSRNDIEASLGNIESSDRMARYCMRDTFYSHMAMEAVKRSSLMISRLLRQAPEVALSTSYPSLSHNLIQCQSLSKRGSYIDQRLGDFLSLRSNKSDLVVRHPNGHALSLRKVPQDDLDIEKEKNRILLGLVEEQRPSGQMQLFGQQETRAAIDEDLKQLLKTKTVANKEVDLYYLTPFVAACHPFINQNRYAKEMIDEIASLGDDRISRVNKLMLAQALQRQYLSLRVHAALNFSPTRGHDKIPSQEYHPEAFIFNKLYDISLESINNEIALVKHRFQEAIKCAGADIIDTATISALDIPREHQESLRSWLEQERIGLYLGKAKIISPSPSGRFLYQQEGMVFGQGIDIRFTRGLKNAYDQRTMERILEGAFEKEDLGAVVDTIKQSLDDLRNSRVPIEDLLYITESCRKDPEQYSARALKNRQVWEKVRADARRGQRFAWGFSQEGELPAPQILSAKVDIDRYASVMFGEEKKDGWSFRSYQSGKSRARTTCGEIAETLLVYNTDDKGLQDHKKRALQRVITDTCQGDEKEILSLS